jgi:hypothetical protein
MALDNESKRDLAKILRYSKKPGAHPKVLDLAFKRLSAVVYDRNQKNERRN